MLVIFTEQEHAAFLHELNNLRIRFEDVETRELLDLDYRTRSSVLEAGFSYPVIRSREKNLNLTALGFARSSRRRNPRLLGSRINF